MNTNSPLMNTNSPLMNTNSSLTLASKLQIQSKKLKKLLTSVLIAKTLQEKIDILSQQNPVTTFLKNNLFLKPLLETLSPLEKIAILSTIAIEKQGQIFCNFRSVQNNNNSLQEFYQSTLKTLTQTEVSYNNLGGIIGYYTTVIKLLNNSKQIQKAPNTPPKNITYLNPKEHNLNITSDPFVKKAIINGIKKLPQMGEIYPVGGAGERLNLKDPTSGDSLPVAKLIFKGKTLLSGLIEDLEAKEYLHYKLFKQQVNTPVAMMVSEENNNASHIKEICKENHWFKRAPESFQFFMQPLLPIITKEGEWSLKTESSLNVKPGGHGVIWKLAKDAGIFEWLKTLNKTNLLIRQINNPITGTDYGLIAFTGIGLQQKKQFGFYSCPRLVNASEGMNVLIKTETENGVVNKENSKNKPKKKTEQFCLTNIEYVNCEEKGIIDKPIIEGEPYSKFPTNTNILFADINTIEKLVETKPLPGLLINMKSSFQSYKEKGKIKQEIGGRLESMMQNIADYITFSDNCLTTEANSSLPTFITSYARNKTISVTKKGYTSEENYRETPQEAFYCYLENAYDLLSSYCEFKMPTLGDIQTFLKTPYPPFSVTYSPSLGPLYSIIAQKINGGEIKTGSALRLDIAEVSINNLNLDGSLTIQAENICGHLNANQTQEYSTHTGKCTLKNVTIINKGIEESQPQDYCKEYPKQEEALTINIQGNGEFIAEDVIFKENYTINVPDGHQIRAKMDNGEVIFDKTKITFPTWFWEYSIDANHDIILQKTSKT